MCPSPPRKSFGMGGWGLSSWENMSQAVSNKLARAQAMSSRCALRGEITWLILPPSGWCQDLTKPGNTYKETNLRRGSGVHGAFCMQPRWGPYSGKKKNAKEAFTPKRKARLWNDEMSCIKWKAQLMPRQAKTYMPREACYTSGTTSNYYSVYICSAFIRWRKGEKCFKGGRSKLSWNMTHTEKSICHNVQLKEFPQSQHNRVFGAQNKK